MGDAESANFDGADVSMPELVDSELNPLDDFDRNRRQIYDLVRETRACDEPQLSVVEQTAEYTTEAAIALGEYLEASATADDNREQVRDRFEKIWMDDAQLRSRLLRSLTDDYDAFMGDNEEACDLIFEMVFETDTDAPAILGARAMSAYEAALEVDLDKYATLTEMPVPHDITNTHITISQEHNLSRELLDVAKIAVGASIALWLHRRFNKE